MPRVLHIVTGGLFAGVERYVCDVSIASAARGWDVAVIGGRRERMSAALSGAARWEAGGTVAQSLRAVSRLGRFDVCHAHMTASEAVAVATRPLHRAPVVATRHFARPRGMSRIGRLAAPWIAGGVARELAVGEFIAANLEQPPDAVIVSGVRPSPCLWRVESRVVLMLQRLEPEKDGLTALRAWHASGLGDDGWALLIHGEGQEQQQLERFVVDQNVHAVTFGGWTQDVPAALAKAAFLFATATAEPLGLSVLDAMAAGVPVVASGAGGHLETVGRVEAAPLFRPGDVAGAARHLRSLRADDERARLSAAGRAVVAERFTIDRHVDCLLSEYAALSSAPTIRVRRALGPRRTA
jgi:glycosyltransferase involved in cell wall biosynthesis